MKEGDGYQSITVMASIAALNSDPSSQLLTLRLYFFHHYLVANPTLLVAFDKIVEASF